jgi:hypothetical protein
MGRYLCVSETNAVMPANAWMCDCAILASEAGSKNSQEIKSKG